MSFSETNLFKLMEKVDNTFTSITGQSISFIDRKGNWLFPLNLDLFTDFCKYIITSEKGYAKCKECNQAFESTEYRKISITKCHMGLSTISIPISLEGKDVFLITLGQILKEGEEGEFYNRLEVNAIELDLDYDKMLKNSYKLKVLNYGEIQARGQFLLILSEYITISETELQLRNKYLSELKEKIELENRLREMEFKFLQSQISPHFLFNTLNLLARTANEEGGTKTANLIYDLSDLLRWSFKSKDSICFLYEEFDCVEKYLHIQKARFGNKLDVEINIEPNLNNQLIPVLTIQPLVENIIIHGIPNGDRKVKIIINGETKGNYAVISIRDTGEGISNEILNRLKTQNNISSGIKNVEERLKLYFKNNAKFNIESRLGVGTKVTISWPLEQREGVI